MCHMDLPPKGLIGRAEWNSWRVDLSVVLITLLVGADQTIPLA